MVKVLYVWFSIISGKLISHRIVTVNLSNSCENKCTLPCKDWTLITAKHGADFRRCEGSQLLHGEHLIETGPERLHLFPDAALQGKVEGEVEVVVNVVDAHNLVLAVGHEINALQTKR